MFKTYGVDRDTISYDLNIRYRCLQQDYLKAEQEASDLRALVEGIKEKHERQLKARSEFHLRRNHEKQRQIETLTVQVASLQWAIKNFRAKA
jgi:hypothetical protein